MMYSEFIQSIKESRENKWFDYSECHHIVPRCIGGSDERDNLIYLTPREHYIAHRLLSDENPENRDLILAIQFMSGDKKHECTPEEYEEARKRFIDSQRGNTYGRGNLGKHRSEDSKKRMSKPRSKEGRLHMSIAQLGNANASGTRSEESIQHMREAAKYKVYFSTCQICGVSFTSSGSRSKYCSTCKQKLEDEKESTLWKKCRLCGRLFRSTRSNKFYCTDCH